MKQNAIANVRPETIETLNELLRAEISAVVSYNRALALVTDYPEARQGFQECQASHLDRVLQLRSAIAEREGEPIKTSTAWGVFATVLGDDAVTVAVRMAVDALAEGEERGLQGYRDLLPRLDVVARIMVADDVYPKQLRTHDIIFGLKDWFEGPPVSWWH